MCIYIRDIEGCIRLKEVFCIAKYRKGKGKMKEFDLWRFSTYRSSTYRGSTVILFCVVDARGKRVRQYFTLNVNGSICILVAQYTILSRILW